MRHASRLSVPLVAAVLTLFVWSTAPAPGQSTAGRKSATGRQSTAGRQSTTGRGTLPGAWVEQFNWRSIGPATMGGRITAIAVDPKDPCTWWAATASGGLLKTSNNGVTFTHQFDREATVSIGDVQVAPSDPKIVWVGTGESNPRNSVSWGDGVYRSDDGGATWKNMGLRKTFQIGRIVIHPRDPKIVYVGALGRLWGPNPERGLYKTTDGGKTWKKILFVDERTGVVDVCMHPQDPDTLLAATYERRRDAFDTNDPKVKIAAGSGLHRTTDGGKTWSKIANGLPTGKLGRIGIDWSRSHPDQVFLVLESERIGKEPENAAYAGLSGQDAEVGARLTRITRGGPAAKAGLEAGDIVLAVNGKTVHSYAGLLTEIRRRLAGDKVRVEVSRQRKSIEVTLTFAKRPTPRAGATGAGRAATAGAARPGSSRSPAGRSSRARRTRGPFATGLGGQRENVHEQQGPDGHEFGGVYHSVDGGKSFARINSVNPRPMYFSQIRVDPSDPQRLYVLGIRLYRSKDGGQTFTADGGGRRVHVDHHGLWIDPRDGRHMILGNDGGIYVTHDRMDHWDHLNHVAIGQFYHVAADGRENYRLYGGLQDNGTWGGPSRTASGAGPVNSDWIRVGGGDGFRCRVDPEDPEQIYFESQNGNLARRHLKTGARGGMRPRPPRGRRYRFNWNTPFVLSHHNPRIYYAAGNHVFRSWSRGDRLKSISPEITRTDRGSATALAESPRDADVLYVGTDDGALWTTRDGGVTWTRLYPAADEGSRAVKADDPKAARPVRTSRLRQHLAGRLRDADQDKDGKVQRAEVSGRLVSVFERADRNKDGVLEPAEIASYAGEPTAAKPKTDTPPSVPGPRKPDAKPTPRKPDTKKPVTKKPDTKKPAPKQPTPVKAAPKKPDTKKPVPKKPAPEKAAATGKPLADLMPGPRCVSAIVPSRFRTGRVYLTLDGHRSDDDAPYVFASEDRGATWRSLLGNLPRTAGSARTLAEDRVNGNVLYLGTEFGAWVSIDRGATWTRLGGNLPTVAVHAFAQPARSDEIVVATHGRSLWALNAKALRQMTAEGVKERIRLYAPSAVVRWRSQPSRGGTLRQFTGENPPSGAAIFYSLGRRARSVRLVVTRPDGETVRELEASTDAGLHRIPWDLRAAPRTRTVSTPGAATTARRPRSGRSVPSGAYRVALTVDGTTLTQPLEVRADPDSPAAPGREDERAEEAPEEGAAETAEGGAEESEPSDG